MSEVKAWLIPLAIHLIWFVGVVYAAGFVIYLCNKLFYRMVGGGRGVCYATGLIGTPIHELSHALMCLLFGHRIVEMRLFQIDKQSGTLGYVSHSYRKSNLYHVLGNYFIGVAPLLVGTGFLYVMMLWLLPDAAARFGAYLSDFANWQSMGYLPDQLAGVGAVFVSFLRVLIAAVASWQFWVFAILSLCIAIHMTLSWADIKGSLGAIPMLAVLLGGVHAALYYIFPEAYAPFVRAMNVAGAYLGGVLMLSLSLSAALVMLALPVWLIRRAVKK